MIPIYGAPPSIPIRSGPSPSMSRPQVFDQFMAETEFPCMPNDDKLANELLCRHQKITPSDQEQASVTALVGRVKSALENISALGTGVLKIDEFREVGSYKKGTMLTRHKVADLVVMVKNLPKHEDGVELGNSIVEMLKTTNQTQNDVFGVVPREFGCEIAGTQAVVRLLLTVPSDQLDNLDPNIHCDPSIIIQNLAALRHAHWFDEHSQPTLKILIRLIKDIKLRCTGLASLDIWTIELLSHYCLTCTPTRDPLPLSLAFRRFWQLISSGFLLHTSIGVADPCDQSRRINHGFELAEAEEICRNGQFICRLLVHGQIDLLLGAKLLHKNIGSETEVATNLTISPSKEVYNKDLVVNSPPPDKFFSKILA